MLTPVTLTWLRDTRWYHPQTLGSQVKLSFKSTQLPKLTNNLIRE